MKHSPCRHEVLVWLPKLSSDAIRLINFLTYLRSPAIYNHSYVLILSASEQVSERLARDRHARALFRWYRRRLECAVLGFFALCFLLLQASKLPFVVRASLLG